MNENNLIYRVIIIKNGNKKNTTITGSLDAIYTEIVDNKLFVTDEKTITYRFNYECYSPVDIICSILHFISYNKYEFKTCYHCQKRYVHIDGCGKRKYCPRISPIFSSPFFNDVFKNKFENSTCFEAMSKYSKQTHQIINNKKNHAITNGKEEVEITEHLQSATIRDLDSY